MFPYAREVELLFVNQDTFIDILNETAAQTFNPLVKALRISKTKSGCFVNMARDIIHDMFTKYDQDGYTYAHVALKKKPQFFMYFNDISHLSISSRDLLYQAIQSFRTNLANTIIMYIQSAILSHDDAIDRYKISVYNVNIPSKNNRSTLVTSVVKNQPIFFKSYPNDRINQDDRNEIDSYIDARNNQDDEALLFICYCNLLDDLIIEIIDTADDTSTLFTTHKLTITDRSLHKLPYFIKSIDYYNYVVLRINDVMDLPLYSYIDRYRSEQALALSADISSKRCTDKLYDRVVRFDEEYNDYRAISVLIDLFMDSYDDPTIHIKDKKNKLIYGTIYNSTNMLINILVEYLTGKMFDELEKLYNDSNLKLGAYKDNMIEKFNQYILKRVSFFAETIDDIDDNKIMFASRYSQLTTASINHNDFDQRINNLKCNPSNYLEVLDILKKSNSTITTTNRLTLNTFEIGCMITNIKNEDIYIIFIGEVKTLCNVSHQYFYSNCAGEVSHKLNKLQLSGADLTYKDNLDNIIEDANLCKMWNMFVCTVVHHINANLERFSCSMNEFKDYVTCKIKQLRLFGEDIYKEIHPYDTIKFAPNKKESLVELIASINYYNAATDDNMIIQCTKLSTK